MQSLLDIAEQGDWDKVEPLVRDLIAKMAAIQTIDTTYFSARSSRKDIELVLPLLHAATEQCMIRRDQIELLVKAMVPAKNTQDNP